MLNKKHRHFPSPFLLHVDMISMQTFLFNIDTALLYFVLYISNVLHSRSINVLCKVAGVSKKVHSNDDQFTRIFLPGVAEKILIQII